MALIISPGWKIGPGVIIHPLTTVSATGGTITTSGNYKIHTFTSTGSITFTVGGTIQYVVVAGGGGGGYRSGLTGSLNRGGGGGGAGGLLTGTMTMPVGTYNIVIGTGGAGIGGADTSGLNGTDSSISGSGITTILSYGGGGGGGKSGVGQDYNVAVGANGKNGGSGGGGGCGDLDYYFPGFGVYPGSSIDSMYDKSVRQGYDGGFSLGGALTPYRKTGGGGGAGGAGSVGSNIDQTDVKVNNVVISGNGGVGLANPIVGSTSGQLVNGIYYLAGGGGGGDSTGGGKGGLGGGGDSYNGTTVTTGNFTVTNGKQGKEGTPNTGGGGGAGYGQGGQGGSGIVIISYQYQ